MRKRRRRLIVTVALLVAVGIFGVSAYQNHTLWERVRRESADFQAPDGWELVGRVEDGSGGCFISCDSPRVTLVYRANVPASAVCARLASAVETQIGRATTSTQETISESDAMQFRGTPTTASITTIPTDDVLCDWSVAAPGISDRGYVRGGSITLPSRFAPPWTTELAVPAGQYAWVEFNSGLD